MNSDEIKRLIQKLETENDITLKEADQMFSFVKLFIKTMLEEGALYVPAIQNKLGQKFHVPTIGNWYTTVARKIEMGFSGNFIFTIPLIYKLPSFYGSSHLATEALQKYGRFEDRVEAITVNQKMLSLFPKYFLDAFEWEERDGLYVLQGDRAGFYRYPRQNPENGKTYTIAQLFEKTLSPAMAIPQEEMIVFSKGSKFPYILQYLQQKVPYAEIHTLDYFFGETVVFTNKESASVARKAIGVSFEELVKNAIAQNIINEDAARELLKGKGEDSYIDAKFTEASIKYIDDMVKRKMEWESTKRAIEDEPGWLGEIR